MKIKTRLLIMGILPVMIFLITGSLFILLNHQKSKALQRIQVVDRLVNSSLKFVLISEHTLHENQRTDSRWIESYKEMEDGIAGAGAYFLSRNENPVIGDMVRSMKKVRQMIETIESKDSGISGEDADTGSRRKGHGADLHTLIMIELHSMISRSAVLKQRANDDLVQGWKTQSLVFISFFLLLAGAMLGFLLKLTSGIHTAIDRLMEGTSAVFSGNLDFRVGLAGEDEFSLLSKAFDQMTQRLQETGSKLRQFAAIIEATTDFVGIADAMGNIQYINPAGRDMLGIGRDEDLKNKALTECYTKETGRYIVDEIIPLTIQNGIAEFESEFLSRSGQLIPYSGVSFAQKTPEDGTPEFLSLIARDISGRRKHEKEMSRLVEALERSNRELEQIAYVASHDLQEPLRKVASFIQLFAGKYQGKIDEKADSYIAYIVDGATRMSCLINDLLIYSRAVAQKAEFKHVDCHRVMETVLSDMEFAIAEKKAAVTFDSLPGVSGDETQMRQLFQNLISNAVKYRKAGEPTALHVSAVRKGPEWIFSFKDNGIGIEPEYFEKIFVLFQRLHTRMDYSGTGIGLAVCKKIVENHGGRIWVESEFEKGSTFYFSLPVP